MGAVTGTTAFMIGMMAMGTGAAIYGATQAGRGVKKEAAPKIMPMPTAPKPEEAAAQAEVGIKAKKRAMARSRSIYTSPLGIGGEAAITKKRLLGQ